MMILRRIQMGWNVFDRLIETAAVWISRRRGGEAELNRHLSTLVAVAGMPAGVRVGPSSEPVGVFRWTITTR